ncbi:MAG: ComEC family competence protein [Clostridiales bacterium]|nr:ComEC family competence protein [Clostridiales bacterium]
MTTPEKYTALGLRPMVWLGGTIAAAMLAFTVLPDAAKWICAASGLCLCAVCIFLRQKKHKYGGITRVLTAVCIGLLAAGIAALGFDAWFYRPTLSVAGRNVDIRATVLDYGTAYDDRIRTRLCVEEVNGRGVRNFYTYIYLDAGESLEPGQRFTGRVHFSVPTRWENIDRETYYRAQRVYVLAKPLEKYTLTEGRLTAYTFLRHVTPARWAHWVARRYKEICTPEDAAIIVSLVLGDKTQLPETYVSDMRTVGLSHVMAVSGMNVSLIAGVFLLLFRRKLGSALAFPAILLFSYMVGAGASVTRAAVMQSVLLTANLLDERSDPINTLFLTLGGMLLVNPYAVQDASLWLSFSATLGLILYGNKLQRLLMRPFLNVSRMFRKVIGIPVSLIATTLAAQVFILPLMVFYFGTISLIAPIANVVVVWAVVLTFWLGIFGLPFTLWPWGAEVLGWVLKWLVTYQRWMVPKLAALPFSTLRGDDPYVLIGMVTLYGHLALLFIRRTREAVRILAASCAICLSLTAMLGYIDDERTWHVTALNTRGGQCAVFTCGDDCVVVNCGGIGAAEGLRDFFEHRGIRDIDLLVVTDYKKGSVGGVAELAGDIPIATALLPPIREGETLPVSGTVIAADTCAELPGLKLRLMLSDAEGRDANRLSVLAEAAGVRFLITGSVMGKYAALLDVHGVTYADVVLASDYYTTHELPISAAAYVLPSYVGADFRRLRALANGGTLAIDQYEAGLVEFTVRTR